MKNSTTKKIEELLTRYPALEICRGDLFAMIEIVCEGFRSGGKLITCGNGGSASECG